MDGETPGEQSQWLAVKFPVPPNRESKFAVTAKQFAKDTCNNNRYDGVGRRGLIV
jgi:hypothetical protein